MDKAGRLKIERSRVQPPSPFIFARSIQASVKICSFFFRLVSLRSIDGGPGFNLQFLFVLGRRR